MALLCLCGMAQQVSAQGYYLYKNGQRQSYRANEMDSLVFYKTEESPAQEPEEEDPEHNPMDPKKATQATAERNNQWYTRLDFEDMAELENAKRGLIEATPDLVIKNSIGEVWNMAEFKFMQDGGEAPSTVNPSLWRNTLCNVQCGLFQVCDGIYQVRGYDMANMTFIKTKSGGWLIFDVLMCKEVAQAALDIFKKNVDSNPRIVAVLISHSHADHYGGVGAIVNEKNIADPKLSLTDQIASGKIAVITSENFMKHVIAENTYCNGGMSRRASYQYGANLPKGVTGRMAMGIGILRIYSTDERCRGLPEKPFKALLLPLNSDIIDVYYGDSDDCKGCHEQSRNACKVIPRYQRHYISRHLPHEQYKRSDIAAFLVQHHHADDTEICERRKHSGKCRDRQLYIPYHDHIFGIGSCRNDDRCRDVQQNRYYYSIRRRLAAHGKWIESFFDKLPFQCSKARFFIQFQILFLPNALIWHFENIPLPDCEFSPHINQKIHIQ